MTGTTEYYELPLPNPAGDLADDVMALRYVISQIDGLLRNLQLQVSEKMNTAHASLFATASQGEKADNAVQPDNLGSAAASNKVLDINDLTADCLVDVSWLASRGIGAANVLPIDPLLPGDLVGKGFFCGRHDGQQLGIPDVTDPMPGALLIFAAADPETDISSVSELFLVGNKIFSRVAVDDEQWSGWERIGADVSVQLNALNEKIAAMQASPTQLRQNLGDVSGSVNIDLSLGTYISLVVVGNTTLSFTLPESFTTSSAIAVVVEIRRTGSFSVTHPSGVQWHKKTAPTLTIGGTDTIVYTKAGSAAWVGVRSRENV